MTAEENDLLGLAERCARAAAAELMARYGTARELRAKSTPTDLVSEADLAAEAAVRALLGAERPGDGILGEEGGETGRGGELRWVVDPLDGTVNFLFGVPQFGVSVACEDEDGTLAGVVFDPVRDECFTATRSGAARLNGEVIEAPRRGDMASALIGTGFAYDAEVRRRQAEVLVEVLPRVRDIRRAGAAALDLAWCACGRLDGYFERGVKHWDRAAGELICRRVGLEVWELPERAGLPWGIAVGPPGWLEELFGLIA